VRGAAVLPTMAGSGGASHARICANGACLIPFRFKS
jgi:hypothetical protein